jgi:hypothetical protein
MMREVRRVSPGRQPTENELCDSQAAAIMTSVSREINQVNFCVEYDKVKSR